MNTYAIIADKDRRPLDGLLTALPKGLERARQRATRKGFISPQNNSKYATMRITSRVTTSNDAMRPSSINTRKWG